MFSEILTKQGRIKKRFQPAIYFDSSVLIDYWVTEGADVETPDELRIPERPWLSVARDILKSDVRFSRVVEIRKKLVSEDVKASCVISPLAIIELSEWHAEAAFKNIAAEASGVLSIQRKSKKEIGSLLTEVLEKRKEEIENNIKGPHGSSTGLEILLSETWLNPSFAKAHGFRGLFEVDLINFELDISQTFDLPFFFAYVQMGLAVETAERSESRKRAPWSGYWFVNVGEGPHRNWMITAGTVTSAQAREKNFRVHFSISRSEDASSPT